VGAVRHLGSDVEPLGEQGDHRLVVLDRLRLLRATGGYPPQRPGQQAVTARAGKASVRIEVVAMAAEDAGEAVGRVGDLDLDPRQPPGEEGAEEAGTGPGLVVAGEAVSFGKVGRREAGGKLRLEPVLGVAMDQVMIVVASEEDESLAGQLLGDQPQQPVGGVDRVPDRAEEEVEEVAEEDQLVDSPQMRRQPFEERLLAQQVPPGPGAKVSVGDDQSRAQARDSTRISSPPLGERVGICRTVIVRPGSASRRNRCSSIVATSFTSVWPKRLPMQIRWPPPKGT
jgi:hypothetical protein